MDGLVGLEDIVCAPMHRLQNHTHKLELCG